MPRRRDTAQSAAGLTLVDARAGRTLDLGSLEGVHLLVLLRHRH